MFRSSDANGLVIKFENVTEPNISTPPTTPPFDDQSMVITEQAQDVQPTPQNALNFVNLNEKKSNVLDCMESKFTQEMDDEAAYLYRSATFDSYWTPSHTGNYMQTDWFSELKEDASVAHREWSVANREEQKAKVVHKNSKDDPSTSIKMTHEVSTCHADTETKKTAKTTAIDLYDLHYRKAKSLLRERKEADAKIKKAANQAERKRKKDEQDARPKRRRRY